MHGIKLHIYSNVWVCHCVGDPLSGSRKNSAQNNKMEKPYTHLQSQGQGRVKKGLPL